LNESILGGSLYVPQENNNFSFIDMNKFKYRPTVDTSILVSDKTKEELKSFSLNIFNNNINNIKDIQTNRSID